VSEPGSWAFEQAAGIFLLLGCASVFVGVMMFWIRGGQRGGSPPNRAYFVWERCSIAAAAVLVTIGFVLLEAPLQATDGGILARIGAAACLFAGVMMAAGEALGLGKGFDASYPLIAVSVVIAFLAQAAFGGALLQSGSLPAWIGWLATLWNIAWLVSLPLVSRRDIYFPVLHYLAPLVIGISLLVRAS
jgi:hypothetical protein